MELCLPGGWPRQGTDWRRQETTPGGGYTPISQLCRRRGLKQKARPILLDENEILRLQQKITGCKIMPVRRNETPPSPL